MIKNLRKKFIIINMSLVTLVFIVIFVVLCFSSYQRMKNESYDSMYHILERKGQKESSKFEIGKLAPKKPFNMFPVFCVTMDKNNNITNVIKDNVEVSDDIIENFVDIIIKTNKNEGTIISLNISFICKETANGTKIAIADLSNMKNSMANLIITSLVVGIGGLIALFFISLFLSELALRPVEYAWDLQRQFIADASHELKTPLTVILANIGILLSHCEDTIQSQVKWIQYMKDESDRMKKLVDDLLFLAKSDIAQTNIIYEKFNFSDMVLSCLLTFESVAFENKILFSSDIKPDILFTGNEEQLKRLIIIFLDNACKYTEKGGFINLELKIIQDKIYISINNSGNPISENDIEHIFKRFYRIDKSRSREKGGYGLGLSIAKNIIENYNGKITVKSNEKIGTTFIVYLPLKIFANIRKEDFSNK